MTSFAFSLALGVLALVNRRIGHSLLYPPAAFSAIWAALLFGLTISGDLFYPVSTTTHCVYLLGALSFSAGGLYCMKRMKGVRRPTRVSMLYSHRTVIRIVTISLILLIVCFPLYWSFLDGLSAASGYSNPWIAIRAKTVALSDRQWTEPSVNWESVVFSNVVTVATLLALVGVAEEGIRRERFVINAMVLMALLYSVLMASTAGAAALFGAILGIKSLKKGRLRASVAALTLAGFIVLFAIVAVVLGKGRTNPSASLSENVAPAVEIVEWYTLGGVVAFDRIVQNPSGIRSSWSISRFFLLTANKLGASFEVPSLHAEYTMISPSMKTNVYTMYFSYFQDYGWAGIVALPYVLGYALTWIYRKARSGSPAALVLYGLTFSGILFSGFAEQFFLALNTLLKSMVVVWMVFSLPYWWRGKRGLHTVRVRARHEMGVPTGPLRSRL